MEFVRWAPIVSQVFTGTQTHSLWRTVALLWLLSNRDPIYWLTVTTWKINIYLSTCMIDVDILIKSELGCLKFPRVSVSISRTRWINLNSWDLNFLFSTCLFYDFYTYIIVTGKDINWIAFLSICLANVTNLLFIVRVLI